MSDHAADRSEHETDDAHPLRRVSLRGFDSLIDQHVRAAEEAGQLRNLPGAGKPLNLGDDDSVPDELRVGFRMLKNAGYAPPWIELQKEIRTGQADLDTWRARVSATWTRLSLSDQNQLRAEHEQRIRDLNKLISSYNLTAPPAAGQIALLQLWREQGKLDATG